MKYFLFIYSYHGLEFLVVFLEIFSCFNSWFSINCCGNWEKSGKNKKKMRIWLGFDKLNYVSLSMKEIVQSNVFLFLFFLLSQINPLKSSFQMLISFSLDSLKIRRVNFYLSRLNIKSQLWKLEIALLS